MTHKVTKYTMKLALLNWADEYIKDMEEENGKDYWETCFTNNDEVVDDFVGYMDQMISRRY